MAMELILSVQLIYGLMNAIPTS